VETKRGARTAAFLFLQIDGGVSDTEPCSVRDGKSHEGEVGLENSETACPDGILAGLPFILFLSAVRSGLHSLQMYLGTHPVRVEVGPISVT